MDVQTELDTIRKSILRRWYAVKIILVSPATRQAQEAGGSEEGGRGRVPDTKTVRFGISQNLWYACIWRRTDSHCPLCSITALSLPPFPLFASHLNAQRDSQFVAPARHRDSGLFPSQLGLFICNRGILPSNYAAVNC